MSDVKFYNLGTMMKQKPKDPNDENEPKKFYIKLEQQKSKDGKPYGDQIFPITLANGKVIKDGTFVAMKPKKEKLLKSLKEEKITEEKYKELVSFLLFDLVVVDDGSMPTAEPKNDEEIPF